MIRFIVLFIIGIFAILAMYSTKTDQPILGLRSPTPTMTMTPTPTPLPMTHIIENDYHIFQTFNNCGPAALSMALSYFGIQKTQHELGSQMRPYQNPQGDNDDKSVTLEELVKKTLEFNLLSYYRPNGSIEIAKQFISEGIPVVTRTRLKETDDIGHFRIIKGYDDTTQTFLQDDSLQGHNLTYSYESFSQLWETFHFEYLVLFPPEKHEIVKNILGKYMSETESWRDTYNKAQQSLGINPDDLYARFSLSIAAYHLGDYHTSIQEFERIEHRLPFRTLWYQIEPIKAYAALKNYNRVFSMSQDIFNNQNRAYSELYLIRGELLKKQGNINGARNEFEKAVLYNNLLPEALQALEST